MILTRRLFVSLLGSLWFWRGSKPVEGFKPVGPLRAMPKRVGQASVALFSGDWAIHGAGLDADHFDATRKMGESAARSSDEVLLSLIAPPESRRPRS